MAIYVRGDTHRDYNALIDIDRHMKKGDYVIVAGDFGYIWDNSKNENILLDDMAKKPYTYLFVDGNHEGFTTLYSYPEELWNCGRIHRIRKNIIHLCRGKIFTIEDKKIFTFGGGYSFDKSLRTKGISWFPEEMPTDEEFIEANNNLKDNNYEVDYIITHTLPLGSLELLGGNYHGDKEWPLNNYLEYIAENVKYKHWYCGHFYENRDLPRNQTILLDEYRMLE